MTGYEKFLLTAHVLAAVIWVGGSVLALTLGYYLRGRDIDTRVEYTRWTEWLGPRLFAPMSIIVIVAGPLLADRLSTSTRPGSTLGFIGWLISFLFGVGFYPREGVEAREADRAERHGPRAGREEHQPRADRGDDRHDRGRLVVIDMTTKPGYP